MSKMLPFLSRRVAVAAVALVAAGAGAWLAWRKNRGPDEAENAGGGPAPGHAAQAALGTPPGDAKDGVQNITQSHVQNGVHSDAQSDANALKALWALELDMPQGGTFKMASVRGAPALVNFWAPWCPPCVEEMPLLDGFFRENAAKKWQVVGLAADQPQQVQQFLLKTPVSFPIALAGYAGIDVTRTFGNITGGLPFTVVLDSQGKIATRHMGKLTAEHLAAFAAVR